MTKGEKLEQRYEDMRHAKRRRDWNNDMRYAQRGSDYKIKSWAWT